MKATTAMIVGARNPRTEANYQELAASLIQARVNELIRPNLDAITLPKLGDFECLEDGLGCRRFPILGSCAPQSSVADEPCLQERGIFQMYDIPTTAMGRQATIHAWGLNKKAQWLKIEIDKRKEKIPSRWGWKEIVVSVEVAEVPLDALLSHMKSAQRGTKTNGAWSYTDDRGMWHFVNSDPRSIWYALSEFILAWHQEKRKQYVRSEHFANSVRLEDFTFENLFLTFHD